MNGARQISLSAAAFALICFFLPWLQVSCMGVKDSVSGFDLARDGDKSLWLMPVVMVIALLAGLLRLFWQQKPALFSFAGIVGGGFNAYLMYNRHFKTGLSSSLIAAQWTVWFWFGIASSIVVALSAFFFYLGRSRAP